MLTSAYEQLEGPPRILESFLNECFMNRERTVDEIVESTYKTYYSAVNERVNLKSVQLLMGLILVPKKLWRDSE